MTNSPQHRNRVLGISHRQWLAVALAVVFALTIAATPSAQAQTFSVLYQFTGGADGRSPHAGLLRDSSGNFYGTTYLGGDLTCNPPYGCGTVFKLDAVGKFSVLYTFTGGADGKLPSADLIQDARGNFYGTTSAGEFQGSYGTVFKLDGKGTLTVLYSFTGGPDGGKPFAGLVWDPAGNLYGTTLYGGGGPCISSDGFVGCGVVFKLTPIPFCGTTFCNQTHTVWKETVLYLFSGGSDGANPNAGLIRDSAGNFYGTTTYGGAFEEGTVFKLDSIGKETVLHSFMGGTDAFPNAGLIQDTSGNLYGTASGNSVQCRLMRIHCGTAFKVDPEGQETVLHGFTGFDGLYPHAGLVRDLGGNLYGTTYQSLGFGNDWGTVFKLDALDNETVLHYFRDTGDGANPLAGLVQDSAGNLYGTTSGRDGSGNGTVFKIIP